jgi:hypothetical protein
MLIVRAPFHLGGRLRNRGETLTVADEKIAVERGLDARCLRSEVKSTSEPVARAPKRRVKQDT